MSMICSLCCASDDEIQALMSNPESIEEFVEGSHLQMDLDKAWHGLHFLLTGSAEEGEEPLCYLLTGGDSVGEVDVGYGPARAILSTQVAAFSDALAAISPEELASRFDPAAMTAAAIYPDIWARKPEEDDTLGYLLEYFSQLKDYVTTAHRNKSGLLIYLS